MTPSLSASIFILFLHLYFNYKENQRTNGEEAKKGQRTGTKQKGEQGKKANSAVI